MPRSRVEPDEFYDDDPAGDGADEWGQDDWGAPASSPVTASAPPQDDSDWGSEEFGDHYAAQYTQPEDDEPAESPFDVDRFTRTPQKPTKIRSGKGKFVLAAAAVAVGVGVGVVMINGGETPEPAAAPASSSTAVASIAPPTTTAAPATVTGSGPGDITSGPGVIFGYTHAYYTRRDGKIASEFLAPDQATPDVVAAIQREIDKTSPVTYELTITATRDTSVFNVVLKATGEDRIPKTYYQQFTVTNQSGRYYLADKRECATACPAQ